MSVLCVEAFDVAEQLGVARLLNADDMLLLVVPDKLNVMTFVYQLRAQLTGATVPPHHSHSPSPISSPPAISSPPPRTQISLTSGDWLLNLCPLTATEQQAVDARYAASLRTSSEVQSVVHTGKQLLACVGQSSEGATSTADHMQTASQSPALNDSVDSAVLMTRQQLLNPFDSDSDSESKSAATLLSSDTGKHQLSLLAQDAGLSGVQQPQTAESHTRTTSDQMPLSPSWKHCEQLAARAGGSSSKGENSVDTHSTGAATHSSAGEGSPPAHKSGVDTVPGAHRQCSRREQLRERARLLLQQARHDAVTSPMPPVVDSEDERHRRLRERARRLIAESRAGAAAGGSITQVITVHSRKAIGQSVSAPTGEMYGCEHILQQQRHELTPADQHDGSPSSPAPATSYAEVEIEFLERSLARLDERAAGVEWSLRRIMDSQRTSDDDAQQRLMYEWFALVDERGELVRRIEQLNAVAQEQDLERRFELLSVELRRLMAEGDANEKDEDCADRERLLLAELMSIVNQRDALVQQLDKQEQETSAKSAPVAEARKNSRQDAACSVQ